ncbi:DNRLRE domain-containing protein [Actinoplanes sp. NPDC023714]|uniref:DNRLRE domain-containing protein n=1 Tax=Actinoplanes sp. NPDC023714 TaxID=3154322 RepID=UPI0034094211
MTPARKRHRRTILTTSLVLLLAAAGTTAVVRGQDDGRNVAAGINGIAGEADASRAARESGAEVRVTGLTSETTEVYALPDGRFRADISTGMQRFRRDGAWVAVDQNLRTTADGTVEAIAHPGDLTISGKQGEGVHDLAAVGVGAKRVAMRWTGALPAPVVEGNRATYVDAKPGVDLVVESTRQGFEQYLIVKSRGAFESVTLGFDGPGAATAKQNADGSIGLLGQDGKESFRIPAPLMWDARRTPAGDPALRKPVTTTLTGRELTLTPDRAWLDDPETQYPVTVDPTLNPAVTTFDTYVRETVTTDQNAEGDLQIGLLATTPATLTRSFLTWDTTVLAGKQITAATVSFWNYWSHTCTATPWAIYTTGTSTYTTRFTSQPAWDATADATSTATHGSTDCADAWATISGTTFFQKAANANKTRAGMGVRAVNETATAGFKQFRSREGAAASEDPKASITYNSRPVVSARATVPATSCVTGASRPLVNSLTPQLKATVTDADGTAMTTTFEWWAVNGTAAIGSASVASVATGGTATVTVPAGAFAEGGSYKWRVKASDGTSGSDVFTGFCEMTVYDTAPPVAGCTPGTASDFNGDGVADVALTEPRATVDGKASAGRVTVVYGGTGERQVLTDTTVESGDQFGFAVSAYDANNDGCTDLAVGVPYQDLGTVVNAGAAYLLFGAPAGLNRGPAAFTYHQDAGSTPETAEGYDYFGYAVAGARTPQGQSYLVVGVPGEDVGTVVDAGVAHYYRGTLNLLLQSGTPIPGSSEVDDQNGYAVAASANHFVIGSPGEAIGAAEFAGVANVFSSWELVNGLPKLAANLQQDTAGIADVAEANDTMGKSVAVAPFAGTTDSLVVVGVPGEDTSVADGGMVQRFRVTAAATFTEMTPFSGTPVEGDYFGESVAVVNTSFIAAGAPGRDVADSPDSGQVRIYPALTDPVPAPVIIEGTPEAGRLLGTSLTAGATHLWVGTPWSENPAVYGFAWSDLAAGTTTPAITHSTTNG